jgi:glyceraldehyde-3-phosphate dehydrogenase/erythrose-4-phosphate dehydrogenase
MAKSQKISVVKVSATSARTTTDEKISAALKQASRHAKRQLVLQGLKLPTQSWTTTAIRNPAC